MSDTQRLAIALVATIAVVLVWETYAIRTANVRRVARPKGQSEYGLHAGR